MADPLVGTTIGRYVVLARLGFGGMGVVYKARDERLGRTVALKFLPSQWRSDDDAKQRFLREAQAASATEHPNICAIYDVEETPNGEWFIVMAHYEGVTLKQRLDGGALGVDEALDVASQVAQGLARAHRAGVVHRDIKPSNIILTADGVKVVDFGLATFADAVKVTTQAAPVGTYAYMSPEQVRAEPATPQSDVWALGVVLYEMLVGRVPFEGPYFEAVAHAITHRSPAPIRAQRPDVPEAVERLVFRALHPDLAVRFASGRELAAALLHLTGVTLPVDLRPVGVEPPQGGSAADTNARRTTWASGRRLVVASVAAGLVLAAMGVARWMWGRPLEPGPRAIVSVLPVEDRTGFSELAPYHRALTGVLLRELEASTVVRATALRTSTREAAAAETAAPPTGAPQLAPSQAAAPQPAAAEWVLRTTVVHENGAWQAVGELRRPDGGNDVIRLQTASLPSSLIKDAAYARVVELAGLVESQVAARTGRRATPRTPGGRLRSLDAVRALDEGLEAMEETDYPAARDAFARAVSFDARHPLPHVWLSRAERALRHTDVAAEAAERANALVMADTAVPDGLLARAVWAVQRQDVAEAETRYRELVRRFPDEPGWRGELAAFLDGQGRVEDAIGAYTAVAPADRPARFGIELCRLYARLDDARRAREEAQRAVRAYEATGARGGAAQALLCEADVLRMGGAEQKAQALQASFDALGAFDARGDRYNVARAEHYVALALAAEGREAEAVSFWRRALDGARATQNGALEAGALSNLGVASAALGFRRQALEYFQQGAALHERLGDERVAARAQANAAAILIEFGPNPEDGLRRADGATRVFRQLGDRAGEVFGLRLRGDFLRYVGRLQEAAAVFTEARAIAESRGLADEVVRVSLSMAAVDLATGDYARVRDTLQPLARHGQGQDGARAQVLLGVALARLGNAADADRAWAEVAARLTERGDTSLRSLLLLSRGEAALESGESARARTLFQEAAMRRDADLPDAASLAAEARRSVLDANALGAARLDQRLATLEAVAGTLRRADLIWLCRWLRARAALDAGLIPAARQVLAAPSPDRDAAIDVEVAAALGALRVELAEKIGDRSAGTAARVDVGRQLEALRRRVPAADRAAFDRRRFIVSLDRAAQ